MHLTHKNYLLSLSILFTIEFIYLAIAPYHRSDWLLENVLVLVTVIVLFFSYHRFPLSNSSYTLIFLFMSLHEVGAHFTYSEVPYDAFLLAYFDFSLNEYMGWTRNNFDRMVHFLYGLLLAYPLMEIYVRYTPLKRGSLVYWLPIEFVMATSLMFELFEWAAAEVFGGDLGVAYLGIQGDIWDAHKDMVLASLGAVMAMGIAWCFRRKC